MEVAFREKNKTEVIRLLKETKGPELECEDALHRACENGWLDVAKIVLNHFDVNPDGCDFYGKTKLRPIHVAARAGQVEIIIFLLLNRAPVDSEDANGSTALHYAMQEGHWEAADTLISRFNANLLKCNLHGSIPLLLGLEKALKMDDSSINFHTLLQMYNKYLLPCTIPYYIIKLAYEKNWTDELLYLLQIDKDKYKQDGSSINHTSLILTVAMSGHVELLTFLLKHDADLMVTDEYGNTALLLAISEGHFDCVKIILEKAPNLVSVFNDKGEGPVRFAVRTRSPEMVSCLVDAGGDPDQEDNDGNTPLLSALRQNSRGIAEYLVKELHCDLGHVNKKGDTPLSMELTSSLYERSVNKALWLLSLVVIDNGENRPSTSNKIIPKDALYMACQQGLIQVVDTLIQIHHCDPLQLSSSSGMSPFHIIVKSNDVNILGHLLAYKSCPSQLVTKSGQTIAGYSKSYPEVTKMLTLGENRNVGFARKPIKIFIIGDSSSGKSSLSHAIKVSTKGTLKRGSLRRRKPTLGIKMRKLELPECGPVILYDCSGYVCTQQMSVLRKLVQDSPNGALFIVVTNVNRKKEEVTENVMFWTSYINSISFVTSYVIIVGSHADQASMSMWGFQNSSSISETCPNLVAGGGVMMDCRKVSSQSLINLLTIIAQSCASLRAIATILHFGHLVLYNFLCENLPGTNNVYILESKLCQIISNDIEYNTLLNEETIHESLSLLSNSGLVFCFPTIEDEKDDQFIILQPHLLLSKVLGALSINHERPLSTNESGLIEERLLIERFPKLDSQIVLLFLRHFNLAIRVPHFNDNNDDPHFFIPSRITTKRDYYNTPRFAWQLQLTTTTQDDEQSIRYPIDIIHMLQMKLINIQSNSGKISPKINEKTTTINSSSENNENDTGTLNEISHNESPTSNENTVEILTTTFMTNDDINTTEIPTATGTTNEANTTEIPSNEITEIPKATGTTNEANTTEIPSNEITEIPTATGTTNEANTTEILSNEITEIPTNKDTSITNNDTNRSTSPEIPITNKETTNSDTTTEIPNNDIQMITDKPTTITTTTTTTPNKEVKLFDICTSKGTCRVWKNGITYIINDVYTVIEVYDNAIALLMTCHEDNDMNLVKQRSSFIRLIRAVKSSCCNGSYSDTELIISPFDLGLIDDPKAEFNQSLSDRDLILFDVNTIADAILNGIDSFNTESGQTVSIKDLLFFDAYKSFPLHRVNITDQESLESLISQSSLTQDFDLKMIGHDFLNLPEEIVSEIITNDSSNRELILLNLFKKWSQGIQSPLKDAIRTLFNEYSIFTYDNNFANTSQNEATSM